MRTVTIGGVETSVLGLGCNNFGHGNPFGKAVGYEATKAVVDAAIDSGVTFFDTADVYAKGESEQYLGRALAGRRDQVFLATKFGHPMPDAPDAAPGSRTYVRWAVEGSLRRLQTDRVDLLQIHRWDPDTPIGETLAAIGELVDEGKVGSVGASNFTPDQLDEATAAEGPPLSTLMTHYSLLKRDIEAAVIPACLRLGITLLPYFPLESGLLTGKYTRGAVTDGRLRDDVEGLPASSWSLLRQLQAFADERGTSLLSVAIGGLAAMPAVGPVPAGATRPEQVRQNAEAAEWSPSAADVAALRALLDGASEPAIQT